MPLVAFWAYKKKTTSRKCPAQVTRLVMRLWNQATSLISIVAIHMWHSSHAAQADGRINIYTIKF